MRCLFVNFVKNVGTPRYDKLDNCLYWMSLNDVLALKSFSTLSEFILKSPDLQWQTSAEEKKHFYPSVRCLKYPTALPRCWDVENTHHQSKKSEQGKPFLEEWTHSAGIPASWEPAGRTNQILALSSCAMIAPSTAGNEKYNSGKAVISGSLEFFPISLFSGNYKEAEFHYYRTWLVFYLLVFISCFCTVLSLWVLGFW